MAERRNSLQPEPAAPRNNKRRRTMMDSVSEVARWLLPSWASEGSSETPQSQQIQQPPAPNLNQAGGSGLIINGERNAKRARTNELSRREPMGRLSPVASMATSTTSTHIKPDFDDGSDFSTSGCSSLSITAPVATQTCSAADTKSSQRRNRTIQNTKEAKTRDVSINVDQTSIVAETSVTASLSPNFSLFSRPSRALSSTMNSTLPLAGSLIGSGTRSLSSSLHKPERSLNRSIFYDGKTTYGGAATHRKLNLFSSSPYQMAAKRSKPASNVTLSESSSAAKRLIEALERINTPVQNAKKIPMGRPENMCFREHSEARRKEALESIASLRQSGPPSLSTCRTPVLPARIGSNVKPVLAANNYTIELDEADVAAPAASAVTSTPRPISIFQDTLDGERSSSSAGGKVKSAKVNQQHLSRKIPVEEEPPPPALELPSAPLPIKDLPSFSFSAKISPVSVAPTQDSHKTSSIRSPLTSLADFSNKPFEKQAPSSVVCSANDASEAFTFSAPVDLEKPTKALHCKEEFSFNDPLYLKKDSFNRSNGFTSSLAPPAISVSASMLVPPVTAFSLKTKPQTEPGLAAAERLSSGSVMDVLGKCEPRKDGHADASKQPKSCGQLAGGLFEGKKSSAATESSAEPASPPATTSVDSSWGDQFKKRASRWDSCASGQPDSSEGTAGGTPGEADKKPAESPSSPVGAVVANQWGDLFKKPRGQWSCQSCLLDNKSEAARCIACDAQNPDAPKPASPRLPVSVVKSPLSAMIKMAPGWSCDVCLLRNNLDKMKCVSCETPKPGTEPAQPSAKEPSAISSVFKFGIPTSDENKNFTSEPVTLVFGMSSTENGGKDAVPNGFKFGVTPAAPAEERKQPTAEPVAKSTSEAAPAGSELTFKFTPLVSASSPAAPALAPAAAAAAAAATTTAATTATPAPASAAATVTPAASASSGFGGFSFGATTAAGDTSKPANAGLFTFGSSAASSTAPAASSAAASKGLSFSLIASPPDGTSTKLPTAATLSFAGPTLASTAPATSATTPSTAFSFGTFSSPNKTPASGSVFGLSSTSSVFGANTTATTATSTQPSASTGFSFAIPSSTGLVSTPSVTTTTAAPASTNPMFTFGGSTSSASSTEPNLKSGSAFVFGNTSASAGRVTGFNFSTATTQAATATGSAAPTFTFSAAPAASNGPSVFGGGTLAASTPAFGSTSANSATAFSAPAPSGASVSTPSVFQFGSSATAAAPSSASPFAFSAPAASAGAPQANTALFSFGQQNRPSDANATAASTSTNPSAVPIATAPFQFSAAATATPAATSAPSEMFSFGQVPPAATNPASNFQFGALPPGQTQAPFQFAGATPNLGQPIGFPASSNAENPFNATTQGRKMRRALRRRCPR